MMSNCLGAGAAVAMPTPAAMLKSRRIAPGNRVLIWRRGCGEMRFISVLGGPVHLEGPVVVFGGVDAAELSGGIGARVAVIPPGPPAQVCFPFAALVVPVGHDREDNRIGEREREQYLVTGMEAGQVLAVGFRDRRDQAAQAVMMAGRLAAPVALPSADEGIGGSGFGRGLAPSGFKTGAP